MLIIINYRIYCNNICIIELLRIYFLHYVQYDICKNVAEYMEECAMKAFGRIKICIFL